MKKKIALVLSGGGARGIAHIGIIEELERRGYEITSIAGTSMGALVGGVYAVGKVQEFKKWIGKLDKLKVFRLVDFTFSLQGLVKGDKVLKAIKEFVPDTNIEDLKIDYSASAADIAKHKEVVFRSGSIYDAIRASIAIPMVLTPVIDGNSVIVDGGVLNNLPISNVKRTDGDLLVAAYVNADIKPRKIKHPGTEEKQKKSAYRKKVEEFYNYLNQNSSKSKKERLSYFSLLDKTFVTASLQMAQLNIERGNPDILINVSRHECGTYDFYRAEDLMETGRQAAVQALNRYEQKNAEAVGSIKN